VIEGSASRSRGRAVRSQGGAAVGVGGSVVGARDGRCCGVGRAGVAAGGSARGGRGAEGSARRGRAAGSQSRRGGSFAFAVGSGVRWSGARVGRFEGSVARCRTFDLMVARVGRGG